MPTICLVTQTYPPEFGAAPSRLHDMMQGLRRAGYDVSVLTGIPNYPKGEIYEAYKGVWFHQADVGGVLVRRHWVFASHSGSKWGRFFNMLSLAVSVWASFGFMRRKKPDYIIAQYPPVMLPITAWVFSKLVGSKFILNLSDIWPSAIADLGLMDRGWRYSLLEKIEHFLYRRSWLCLAQSMEIKNHIAQWAKTPVMLYRTGVDTQLFAPQPHEAKQPVKMVYMGVLGLAHGVLAICKTLDFVAMGVELHIFGDGAERAAIEAYINNRKIGIFLHQPIDAQQVPLVLPSFDVALVSQKTKVTGTVPSKIYEAMACGLPLLFHGAGEGAELVMQHQSGLVSSPLDFEGLKQHILTLKESASLRAQLGSKGREAAVSFYNRQNQIDAFIRFLQANHQS